MNFNNKIVSAFCITATIAVTTNAEFTGNVFMDIKSVNAVDGFDAEDFNGTVIDLWAESDNEVDVLLNVYSFNDVNLGITYYQSFTGATWLPSNLGGVFETPALMIADSYVSIGSYNDGSQPNNDGTGLDPDFGGSYAAGPQAYAGWYNGNPSNISGSVELTKHTTTGKGVFIGRFSIQGNDLDMAGGTGFLTYNQGSGTPGYQIDFTIVVDSPVDTDGDGIPDNKDACPNDPDNDIDYDGVCGDVDAFPNDSNEWADSDEDGIGDNQDNYFENYTHFACCVTSSCFVGTDVQCTAVGGTWIIENESCDDYDCVAPPETCDADLDGDGEVKVADLLLLIGAWGVCP